MAVLRWEPGVSAHCRLPSAAALAAVSTQSPPSPPAAGAGHARRPVLLPSVSSRRQLSLLQAHRCWQLSHAAQNTDPEARAMHAAQRPRCPGEKTGRDGSRLTLATNRRGTAPWSDEAAEVMRPGRARQPRVPWRSGRGEPSSVSASGPGRGPVPSGHPQPQP